MAPPFRIGYTPEALEIIGLLRRRDAARAKKVRKSVETLRDTGPAYPGLRSHRYSSLTGPNGEEVWQSYVENRAPGAWRMWWVYGPGPDTITIVSLGHHP